MSKEEKASEARRKAKEYVKGELSATFDDVVNHFADKIFSSHELEVAFIYGYNSRSTEVDMLRKALRELVELVEDIDDTLFQHNYSIVGWHLNGEQEPIMNFVADFDMDILTKAKSLLKTEE